MRLTPLKRLANYAARPVSFSPMHLSGTRKHWFILWKPLPDCITILMQQTLRLYSFCRALESYERVSGTRTLATGDSSALFLPPSPDLPLRCSGIAPYWYPPHVSCTFFVHEDILFKYGITEGMHESIQESDHTRCNRTWDHGCAGSPGLRVHPAASNPDSFPGHGYYPAIIGNDNTNDGGRKENVYLHGSG